jgi:hypothetical protein
VAGIVESDGALTYELALTVNRQRVGPHIFVVRFAGAPVEDIVR